MCLSGPLKGIRPVRIEYEPTWVFGKSMEQHERLDSCLSWSSRNAKIAVWAPFYMSLARACATSILFLGRVTTGGYRQSISEFWAASHAFRKIRHLRMRCSVVTICCRSMIRDRHAIERADGGAAFLAAHSLPSQMNAYARCCFPPASAKSRLCLLTASCGSDKP